MRTSLQAWLSRNVEGPLEDLAGGKSRLRIIIMLACILALDPAEKATLGAVAAQLKPALHINNVEIGLLFAVTVASSALWRTSLRASRRSRGGRAVRYERFAAFLRVLDFRRALPRWAVFLAAEPDFFAGVRLLSWMLFCSSDMKSTTLVEAFFGIAASSAAGARTTPLALMRASITLVRRSRKSSWYSPGF
ncbi:MAG TPA: hypothetical protein VN630_03555, partial [Rhodanobacteraceae bacterium]|nr:hypothetical protein [Rhodanobacteraceae bacterium]